MQVAGNPHHWFQLKNSMMHIDFSEIDKMFQIVLICLLFQTAEMAG